MPYDPSFYVIFWGHFFANMGGGGGQDYFQLWKQMQKKIWGDFICISITKAKAK